MTRLSSIIRRSNRRKQFVNEVPVGKLLVSEASFQKQVIELADMMGWQHWHFPKKAYQAIREGKFSWASQITRGWPDLALMRLGEKPRFVLMELKGTKTPITPEQVAVNAGLRLCGIEAYIFRPKDIAKVAEVLQRCPIGGSP